MKLTFLQRTFAPRTFRSVTMAGLTTRGPYRVAGAQQHCSGATAAQDVRSGATTGQSHV